MWIHFISLVIAATGAASVLDDLPAEDRRELESGETVVVEKVRKAEGVEAGQALVVSIAEAPVEAVWKELRAVKTHVDFLPRLRRVAIYRQDGDTVGLSCTLRVAFRSIDYHVLQTFDESEHTMTWRLDESKENEVDAAKGSWSLHPYGDGKTLIVYRMYADADSFLPGWLERMFLNRDLDAIVGNLRKRAESGGTWEK